MGNAEGLNQAFLGEKIKELNYMTSKTFVTLWIVFYDMLLIAMDLSEL